MRCSAEGGDVFDREVKAGLFHLKSKVFSETLFQDPERFFILVLAI